MVEWFLSQPKLVFTVAGLVISVVLYFVWQGRREEERLRRGGRWRR